MARKPRRNRAGGSEKARTKRNSRVLAGVFILALAVALGLYAKFSPSEDSEAQLGKLREGKLVVMEFSDFG